MSKQTLTQKQTQKQTASMQTVQFMKMLEMSANRIEDEIKKALEENPALEIETEDFPEETECDFEQEEKDGEDQELISELTDTLTMEDIDSYFDEDHYTDDYDDYISEKKLDYELQNINSSKDDKYRERIIVNDFSLQENLLMQLHILNISEQDKIIAEYIVGNLDDSGYLNQDNRSIASELHYTYNIITTPDDIERIITSYIQQLDPAGVGARNLQECILIQLSREESSENNILAIKIIKNYFNEFSKKHYDKIMSYLQIDEDQLRQVLSDIQKMDPRPAFMQSRGEQAFAYIIPDFIVTIDGGKLNLSLNNQFVPTLRVNKDLKEQYHFLNSERNKKIRAEAERFIKKHVEDATVFINTLSQRELTLYNTMFAIMQKQKAFFMSGNEADIKPMILKDIAAEVGIDISTVSRVSSSKYVQTPFGTYPIKMLFSESIGNEDVSSIEVKSVISALLNNEEKNDPLTDDRISELLKEKGYVIARRTVAKYREQLGIPVARLRRTF